MDNASKNAGEMITALQMKYNRGRQAAITNELVDIITGACCFRSLFQFRFCSRGGGAVPRPLPHLLSSQG
jgi:hypothetical protein